MPKKYRAVAEDTWEEARSNSLLDIFLMAKEGRFGAPWTDTEGDDRTEGCYLTVYHKDKQMFEVSVSKNLRTGKVTLTVVGVEGTMI